MMRSTLPLPIQRATDREMNIEGLVVECAIEVGFLAVVIGGSAFDGHGA